MTVIQVAAALGISPSQVHALMRNGTLHPTQMNPPLFNMDEVEAVKMSLPDAFKRHEHGIQLAFRTTFADLILSSLELD
jgi:hypothetical protein